MKLADYIFVVGDQFKRITNCEGVVAYSDFMVTLAHDHVRLKPNLKVVVGQGVSPDQRAALVDAVVEADPDCRVCNAVTGTPAGQALTHKHKPENILITEPEQVAEDEFFSELCLDAPAELSDHCTEKHIPGMVFSEAARQMLLAVGEKFLVEGKEVNRYFVYNNFRMNFFDFIFPLPVSVHCKLIHKEVNKRGNIRVRARVDFHQFSEKNACDYEAEFSIYEAGFIRGLEKQRTGEVLGAIADSFEEAPAMTQLAG